ncbi:MAG: hypothetical protein JNL64_14785 [Blastocatellia bacterium]|nr:hypothetical protein [Blastocatellia bacterium]
MYKHLLLIVTILFSTAAITTAQSGPSCSCSVQNRCSVSQTCNPGWNAVCECGATGCTSSCEKITEENNFSVIGFEAALASGDSKTIQNYLRQASGRNVEFIATNAGTKLSLPRSTRDETTLWDAFALLSKNGRLRVGGQDFAHWIRVREMLNRGEEYTICSDQVKSLLRHLEFVSGKRFTIVSGDVNSKLNGPVTGLGVNGVLETLKKVANIEVVGS